MPKKRFIYRIEWLVGSGVGGRGIGSAKVEATSAPQAREMVSKSHNVPKAILVIRSRTEVGKTSPVHFTGRKRRR